MFVETSKRVLLGYQDKSGAFVASPLLNVYKYCWLRDATFVAYSLDCIGENAAAEKFYLWVSGIIMKQREKINKVTELSNSGQQIPMNCLLHARYTLDGNEVEGEWGTYQLDGYGILLWGIRQHADIAKDSSFKEMMTPAVGLIVEYLSHVWNMPNYDLWEEYGEHVHLSTLAAIYGGLKSVAEWFPDSAIVKKADDIKAFIMSSGVSNGHFSKWAGSEDIDSSLLWLHVPFGVVSGSDPVMKKTVARIENELLFEHGLHRYRHDIFYGGGQWILLSAWLGWHYAEIGETEKAKQILLWIERQFDSEGYLPEQVKYRLLSPENYDVWISRWGSPARLLLWSHAMHIILDHELNKHMKKGNIGIASSLN